MIRQSTALSMEEPLYEGDVSDYYFRLNQWKLLQQNNKLKRDFTPYKKKLTRIKYWNRIRNNIIKRDNGVCRECSSTERIEVHHIDKNCKNNTSENLITLCYGCRSKRHENDSVSSLRRVAQ